MWNWLRRTRLFTQLREIAEERRSIRLAEHRYSLRLKRAAVRSRVLYEIQRKRVEEVGLQVAQAKLLARLEAAQSVLAAHEEREKLLRKLFKKRGVKMPERTKPEPMDETETEFKDKLFKNVEGIVGDGGGVVGRDMARGALKESFGNVRVGGSEKDMAAGLVAGVAKEIGLSREELRGLVDIVERDGGDVGLRGAVMEALDKEPSPQR